MKDVEGLRAAVRRTEFARLFKRWTNNKARRLLFSQVVALVQIIEPDEQRRTNPIIIFRTRPVQDSQFLFWSLSSIEFKWISRRRMATSSAE